MRHTFLVAFLFSVTVAFSQASKKMYDVKYYFGESVFQFKTNNIDSIKNKTTKDFFLPDSIETFRNGKLEGPKIDFSDGAKYIIVFKNGKIVLEDAYDKDGVCILSSFLDSTKLDKTEVKITSGLGFLRTGIYDTIQVVNKTVPIANTYIIVRGTGIYTQNLGNKKYAIKVETKSFQNQKIKVDVITLLNNYSKKNRERVEIFYLPIHSE